MFSAFKGEVVLDDDATTSYDKELAKTLAKHGKVVCCGEAMSHCVNYSVRDLLSGWPEGRAADIVVLEDAASPVGGFQNDATTFLEDMKKAGVTVCKAKDLAPPPKATGGTNASGAVRAGS